jgi:ADP-heptose:LPS heptosyltransferase
MTVEYRRILLIKPGAIGDLLQLTPVIRALHASYPEARISLLVGSQVTAQLFSHHPLIHETIVFDRRGEHRSVAALLRFRQQLRRAAYDLVLNFQRSNLRIWLLVTGLLPCRVLLYRKARSRVVHAVMNHLETLQPLGLTLPDPHLELFLGDDERQYAEQLFREEGLTGNRVVALNPGASHRVNCWGGERFARLADLLADLPGVRVIIIGGREDLTLAAEISAAAKSAPLVLTGKTTLLQLGAVLERCRVVVSGDTGPMHLATAVGTKVVALFGAADPERTGPVGSGHRVIRGSGVACVPCRKRSCAHVQYLACMAAILPEEVHGVVAGMLGGTAPEGSP